MGEGGPKSILLLGLGWWWGDEGREEAGGGEGPRGGEENRMGTEWNGPGRLKREGRGAEEGNSD